MNKLEIKNARNKLGLSQTEFGKTLGVGLRIVQYWEKGERDISDSALMLLKLKLETHKKELNAQTSHIGTEQSSFSGSEGKILSENNYPYKNVFVVPVKGKGGLEQAYYDDMALNDLQIEKLSVKTKSSKGSKWFKIEVEGISMDDSTDSFEGSKYSLCEGDWAYCRSIPKIHWRNKLHFNKVKVFCFFHNTRGIIFKKIKKHNIENGEITLTSLNNDKNEFPDFHINVAECSYICNVLKVLSEF